MSIGNPTRRTVIVTSALLALGVTAIAGGAVAASYKNVTVEVDGISQPVDGFFMNVSGALNAAGIQPKPHDVVAPRVDSAILDGDTVVVRSASAYNVIVDGKATQAWSTAASVGEVLADVDSSGAVVLAADRSLTRETLPAVAQKETINVLADGKTIPVIADGSDIHTILKDAGVTVSALDRVQFISKADSLSVKVSRVTRGNVTETVPVAHSSEQREDDSLEKGVTRILQEGSDGEVETTYYRETVDGQVSVQAVISERRKEPVTEIVAVGTKEETLDSTGGALGDSSSAGSSVSSYWSVPASASAGADYSSPEAPAPASTAGSDVWAALARCESGGNPSINTGNGYYGMYQFSLATWQSVGGSGLPSDASAEEQTARAQQLQARAGWGQWPACASRLGLY